DQDGNWEIYTIASDGSGTPLNLTNSPSGDTQPDWFRSGGLLGGSEWIVFTSDRDGNLEIYIMAADGSELRNVTNNSANDSQPAATRGNGTILFTSDRDGNQEVYSIYEDGSGLVNLTNNPANDSLPAWSSDGDWIAFTTNRDGQSEVYVMNKDGEELYNVTQNPAEDYSWTWR
ncbi:MAG TPA: hypothetical protein EYP88_03470, partial [Anaerolineales bacterium]|nr:hypothetical protein [Anaerolineales bacterium]